MCVCVWNRYEQNVTIQMLENETIKKMLNKINHPKIHYLWEQFKECWNEINQQSVNNDTNFNVKNLIVVDHSHLIARNSRNFREEIKKTNKYNCVLLQMITYLEYLHNQFLCQILNSSLYDEKYENNQSFAHMVETQYINTVLILYLGMPVIWISFCT